MMQNKSTIIGITGGTGVGKSTVCDILKNDYDALIIDADDIAHKIIKKGENAYTKIVEYFGQEILDCNLNIDRKRLGHIVFKNKKKLLELEMITHKYIILDIIKMIEQGIKSNAKYIAIDAPLLVETNLHKKVDTIWLVDAPIDIRIRRLKNRDSASKEDILKRIDIQSKFSKLEPYADFIIQNDGKNSLEDNIKKIIQKEI